METLILFLSKIWATLCQMSPYLLFGFFVSGLLSVFISPNFVERHLGGKGLWPVFKASILGVPLPLCSCAVIPVASSLKRKGASRGATSAFLISTPQTAIDSFFITWSLLGPIFAIFRPLAALISGFLGGGLISIFVREKDEILEVEEKKKKISFSSIWQIFRYGFFVLPRDIGRSLLLGILIAGLLAICIPDHYFAAHIGHTIYGKFAMLLIGILSLCLCDSLCSYCRYAGFERYITRGRFDFSDDRPCNKCCNNYHFI